jgi:orotate phosphoribosyltransferase
MKPYQRDFIQFAIASKVLKFGNFELKSGRKSPYFFNAGMFSDGDAFYQLSSFYADVINDQFKDHYDILFGPAYKGIALATSAAMGLRLKYDHTVPVSFNRKEAKDHGEGGQMIGASVTGKRVLLIDDVITAGTTIRESVNLLKAAQGKLVGIVIALDRQEKGLQGDLSAIQEVEQEYGLKVSSIITLDNLIEYLTDNATIPEAQHLNAISEYRTSYGINHSMRALL